MTTFKDLGLNPMILQALEELGYEQPTKVQGQAIPHLLNTDRDLIGLAQTGTGKTAAFSLPIIEQLDDSVQDLQTLVLCPTRELAIQVAKEIKGYMKYLPKFSVVPVFGGESMEKQARAIRQRPQIIVGTPGRVNDMIKRRIMKVDSLRWLVLDEADEMLNMGFKEEIDSILETMPDDKQVLLFSATMNQPVRRIASNYMNKPEEIVIGDKNKGSDNVQHFYYVVHERDRYQALRRIADNNTDIHGIIFCRTRRETQEVADKLIQDHYSAEAIHGEVAQSQRTQVMNRFRDKKTQFLVATDVAARGIDVSGLTHVINYKLPESTESYVHRSGRTGRANSSGTSLVIVNMRERYKIRNLERKIGQKIEQQKIPSGENICESQLVGLIDKIKNTEVNETQIGKYIEMISAKLENLDREELIKKFVSVEFNRFLAHYQNATDLNSNVGKSDRRDSRDDRGGNSILMAHFKMNIGKNQGLDVKELLHFLNDSPGLKGVEIGNIEIRRDSTDFEVDQNYKDKVLAAFAETDVNDIAVKISCVKTGVKSSRSSGGGGRSRRRPSRHRNGGGGGGRRRRR